MGDNDFPMTMANGSMGFLQTYVKGMQDYQQAGTGEHDFTSAQQMRGGPKMQQMIAGVPDFDSRDTFWRVWWTSQERVVPGYTKNSGRKYSFHPYS